MSNYWNEFPQLETDLIQVKQFILDLVKDEISIIKTPIEEIINAGGKMLRPAFVFLGAGFGKYDRERILPIAACVEFLHTATLIHDDIIDESRLRRGIESVQSKYSKDVAVLLGDYIFASVFEILAGDYPVEMLKNLSKAIMKICKGELTQYTYRYSDKLDRKQYNEIIQGKTAALFSMSLYAGGYEGGLNNKDMESLTKVGYNIGMMFQIIDDCLDFKQSTQRLGKSAVNDIKQGYITLPMFYALEADIDQSLYTLVFKSELKDKDFEKIKDRVIALNGVSLAKQQAKIYQDEAIKVLENMKDCESKEVLTYIVTSLMDRPF